MIAAVPRREFRGTAPRFPDRRPDRQDPLDSQKRSTRSPASRWSPIRCMTLISWSRTATGTPTAVDGAMRSSSTIPRPDTVPARHASPTVRRKAKDAKCGAACHTAARARNYVLCRLRQQVGQESHERAHCITSLRRCISLQLLDGKLPRSVRLGRRDRAHPPSWAGSRRGGGDDVAFVVGAQREVFKRPHSPELGLEDAVAALKEISEARRSGIAAGWPGSAAPDGRRRRSPWCAYLHRGARKQPAGSRRNHTLRSPPLPSPPDSSQGGSLRGRPRTRGDLTLL